MKRAIIASVVMGLAAASPAWASSVPPIDLGRNTAATCLGAGAASVDVNFDGGWYLGGMTSILPYDLGFDGFLVNSAVRVSKRLGRSGGLMWGATFSLGESFESRDNVPDGVSTMNIFPVWMQPALNVTWGAEIADDVALVFRGTLGPSVSFNSQLMRFYPLMPNAELALRFGTREAADEIVIGGGSILSVRSIF